ncbi:MAG: N-acetyltransferase [Planctomycetota bacterium]|jgi:RimJ/RimL family protein N-acetyltransferase
MEFRETIQEDLDFMADHSVSRGIAKYQPECIDYCYTLEHEGKPLGIGGFRLINKTTSWCWVDMSDSAGKHIPTCYRVIKEWIDKFVEEHQLKRLQAYVECDFPEAIRMVQHLGFEWESNMENFMGDKDAFMYRRLI